MFIRIYTEYSGVVKKLNVITGGINMASPQQVASFLYTALEFKEVTTDKEIRYAARLIKVPNRAAAY